LTIGYSRNKIIDEKTAVLSAMAQRLISETPGGTVAQVTSLSSVLKTLLLPKRIRAISPLPCLDISCALSPVPVRLPPPPSSCPSLSTQVRCLLRSESEISKQETGAEKPGAKNSAWNRPKRSSGERAAFDLGEELLASLYSWSLFVWVFVLFDAAVRPGKVSIFGAVLALLMVISIWAARE
jgi:hypothetical protein